MIARYSHPEMSKIWSAENRFSYMLEVEKSVALVQGDKGIIPKKAAQAIQKKSQFNIDQINDLEKTLKHDVIAFVQNVAHYIGPMGRYFHFGLTSSDVLDTALSLQINQASLILFEQINILKVEFKKIIKAHKQTICAGRTHGMWAEPITFGLKMGGFLAELERNEARLKKALVENKICKLSGAVGTYSVLDLDIEAAVAKKLGLVPETIATQVIPRDRLAQMISAIAFLVTGYERLAIELRHLQRSEVGEILESFLPGQKGSSAMPHKQNPITAENITGLARLCRSYVIAAFENIALWHERDISHSSVERVILPDAFILADYSTRRLIQLLSGLYVNKDQMKLNIDKSGGLLMSSHFLLLLVEKGLTREKAYEMVQAVSFESKTKKASLYDLALSNSEIMKLVTPKELNDVFSGKRHLRNVNKIINRVL